MHYQLLLRYSLLLRFSEVKLSHSKSSHSPAALNPAGAIVKNENSVTVAFTS